MTIAAIDAAAFIEAVEAAIRAPSMHNSQPWRFRMRAGTVEVLTDSTRSLPASDSTGWATRIACGAAMFNLRLTFAVLGHQMDLSWRPFRTEPAVVAVLTPREPQQASPLERSLRRAIPLRHSNREPFWPQPVPLEARARLVDAAREEGTWLELVTETAPVAAVAEIAQAAHRVLQRNPTYVAELAAWTRTSDAGAVGVGAVCGRALPWLGDDGQVGPVAADPPRRRVCDCARPARPGPGGVPRRRPRPRRPGTRRRTP